MPTKTFECLSSYSQRWQPLTPPQNELVKTLKNAETEAGAVASHTVGSDNAADNNDTSSGSMIPADDALNDLGAPVA